MKAMDTSIPIRLLMIAVLFVAAMAVVYGNFRLLAFILLRRKVSRLAKVTWPALGLLLVLCVVDAFVIEPAWIQVTRHAIRTPKLPAGARIRIVQLADIHLQTLGGREIQMVNRTLEAHPDVIVLTGDQCVVKNAENSRRLRDIGLKLSRIAPTYAIEGNWDTATDMLALRLGGVRPLDGWTIVRSRDHRARVVISEIPWNRTTVSPVPAKWRPFYAVGLRHVPNVLPEAAKAGYDLVLAGHTHGGQVRLPIFGALLPDRRLVGKYQAGMYEEGSTLMYVSRGIGLEARPAPQVRFLCRPEVAVIDVVGKP